MPPRSIWNGTITFGLTVVPIKVHSANEDHQVRFHQLHAADTARIRQRRVCAKDGDEVEYKDVAKGYEVKSGEYVVLSQDEIKAAGGEHSHLVELEQFVPAAAIDPDYYDRTYYLGAGKGGHDAYRLLHDALAKAERVGIGRWVFHNREYLVAVRALREVIALHTMRFADELVDPEALDIDAPGKAPSRRESEMAGKLVESLRDDFDPTAYADEYQDRVRALIDAKARGEEPQLPEEEEPEDGGTDLAAALEASLAGAR